jgi:hypothetical protein
MRRQPATGGRLRVQNQAAFSIFDDEVPQAQLWCFDREAVHREPDLRRLRLQSRGAKTAGRACWRSVPLEATAGHDWIFPAFGVARQSPRHRDQRKHAAARVFRLAYSAAPGFRAWLGSNNAREPVVGIVSRPSAHGAPLGCLVSVAAVRSLPPRVGPGDGSDAAGGCGWLMSMAKRGTRQRTTAMWEWAE